MAEPWSGAVLTGGASTRMGRDKALLSIDGEAMAARVASALTQAGARSVSCIGGDRDALAALGLDAIADDHPGAGPLGGVLTALAHAATEVVVVSPCDLTAPDPSTFTALLIALFAGDADVAVPVVDGRWRPLPVVVRRRAHARLADAFDEGERAVHRALDRVHRVTVPIATLPDVDTPEDLPDRR